MLQINSKVVDWDTAFSGTTEASTAGFRPGVWPEQIEVSREERFVNVIFTKARVDKDREGEITKVVYTSILNYFQLNVIND